MKILVDPSAVVPVSVTGNYCALRCRHCNAVYLKHMVRVSDMEKFARSGRKVFLISGGMTREGEIPFEPLYDVLSRLKREYSLKYNFHIGFPKSFPKVVEELADVVSADFFSDSDVLFEIYGLRRDPEHILEIMRSFTKPVVPHVTVGVRCGELSHEIESLNILSRHFKWIVLNVFIPTPGTFYENCPPPPIKDVVNVFEEARKLFKVVFLGCMQPRGKYRLELQREIENLVSGITKPVLKKPTVSDCCAFQVIRSIYHANVL